ncbi:gamma-glutamyl-gamma-aminobutyrate hydrolase family protein [Spongiactinospora sp. TRM90649]|uniref:gamma-glutamyl-gamma-aminobutyrate hydrolase family protein n=1 Tax=Spongiactinospora sp. TRM90649 TaxID=3031114 RepID=UPI0023F67257|nr:gamma-glutamyl-gamma-aminobutyrate hydrolase family protein [Spongiactinospora sp. TRM90649]MDF5752650.1 gamma-glutamyl-gamma-aminobutyrate hydrolase family protein [Spongiactinospora sp. TRM90649]
MTHGPVIGITCYVEQAAFGAWDLRSAVLPYEYVEHVERAGGVPVVIPPSGAAESLIDRLDGLIVAGGGDIDPVRYGRPLHPRTTAVRAFRDEAELALTRAALRARLPYLGICRGLQVLNVALGGTLCQHLPDVVGHTRHAPAPGSFGVMPVYPIPGTLVSKIVSPGDVHHYHHQAVADLAAGLTASAYADDGSVEAVELEEHPFTIAVQWHPERGEDPSLFAALVAAASAAR